VSFAATPEPPYWAVIFTSVRTPDDDAGYAQTAEEMERLAAEQPGFLGIESVRDAQGIGITVSYWSTQESIAAWRANGDHRTAQRLGRERWYRAYDLRIARVERAYGSRK
jgi:heme-degrading monooxygenase HmoA